jgi:subtilisin family serine protease
MGVTNVAAAGNEAHDLTSIARDTVSPNDWAAPLTLRPVPRDINSGCMSLPTEAPGVIVVSSITSASALSTFSSRGLGMVDVAAPGSSIYSTLPPTTANPLRFGTSSGTSMASPHVAGVAALVKSTHPDWTPDQIEAAIRAQATDTACPANPIPTNSPPCIGTTADNSYYGDGIVNALKAVTE